MAANASALAAKNGFNQLSRRNQYMTLWLEEQLYDLLKYSSTMLIPLFMTKHVGLCTTYFVDQKAEKLF